MLHSYLKPIQLTLIAFAVSFLGHENVEAQNYYDWDSYTVYSFYEKVDLEFGAKGDDGRDIYYIYLPTSLDSGTYEITITDADGDLYEITGTSYYIEFLGFYGFAAYDDGVLVVHSSGGTFYKESLF